jgi:hypothetical protein
METVRPVDSGHGIIGCSGDPGNGTSGPIRVFKPTVSPLTIPLVYCPIKSFQRASSVEKPWPGGEKRRDGRASPHEAW